MASIDHWHPVLLSRDVAREPVAVRLAERELVVFRGKDGRIAALDDVCPHRGMRLSRGDVVEGNIVCPYHGWAFDPDGKAVVPPARNRHACAARWDTIERYGLVWVKPTDVVARFPRLELDGFHHVSTFRREVRAPLELVLDNFIEVEHTPSTHALLGYPSLDDVETRVETTDETVYVHNVGPQKWIPRLLWPITGIRTGDEFTDEWTTFFSPVYTVYDHIWRDRGGGGALKEHLRSPVFFVPIDDQTTNLIVSIYSNRPRFGRLGFNLLGHAATSLLSKFEVDLDVEMVESLADKSTSLAGRKLSRFDTALGKARERIDRVYRGSDSVREHPHHATADRSAGE